MIRTFARTSLAALVLSVAACSGGGSDDSGAGDSASTDGSAQRTSQCGVVKGGVVSNPIDTGKGVPVTISAILGSNALAVTRAEGAQAVKLHVLGPVSAGESYALSMLAPFVGQQATLFETSTSTAESCAATLGGGGQGIVGQLVTAAGQNVSEELIKSGAQVTIEPTGSCGEDLIAGCYSALKDSSAPKTMGELTDFLWKPKAESAYNRGGLVIHAGPCNATVFVNGEALPDFGPGNGRCNTSRSAKSGCGYGNGVTVEIVDNDTGLPYTHNGVPYVTVPRGCDRFEFKF